MRLESSIRNSMVILGIRMVFLQHFGCLLVLVGFWRATITIIILHLLFGLFQLGADSASKWTSPWALRANSALLAIVFSAHIRIIGLISEHTEASPLQLLVLGIWVLLNQRSPLHLCRNFLGIGNCEHLGVHLPCVFLRFKFAEIQNFCGTFAFVIQTV